MNEPVRRALVSVFDKSGVVEFARGLRDLGVEIVSTGRTAELLAASGVSVVPVEQATGFPEMLGGRVKTLHPSIHAAILASSKPGHLAELERAGIAPFDLVVVNLYPFEAAVAEGRTRDEIVEMIDIGGPAMLRAAAKNHERVAAVVDPADYEPVLSEIREAGAPSLGTRRRLALKAFRRTAAYDAAIAAWLAAEEAGPARPSAFPETLALELVKEADLVYGENPHQAAALYREPGSAGAGVLGAAKLQGKPLSFNNVLDLDAALHLAAELARPAAVIVKHGNPCGAAVGASPAEAFRRALECDPVSAFGGAIAFNVAVDGAAAALLAEAFYEAVIAPGFEEEARQVLSRRKNLRLLAAGDLAGHRRTGWDLRRVQGGLLAQQWDAPGEPVRSGRVATRRQPSEEEWGAMEFAWRVVRHVRSNAIVYAFADRTVGIGAGQMSRVDSARLGIEKARVPLRGAAMASDAFFPFPDSVELAAGAGITAVVQPGGSIRDAEVVAMADAHDMTMVLTGRRHFRH